MKTQWLKIRHFVRWTDQHFHKALIYKYTGKLTVDFIFEIPHTNTCAPERQRKCSLQEKEKSIEFWQTPNIYLLLSFQLLERFFLVSSSTDIAFSKQNLPEAQYYFKPDQSSLNMTFVMRQLLGCPKSS